jgi:DNA polymerase elongation subunit (family B)
MHLWHWNESGERVYTTEPFKPYLYIESQNGKDGTSIYNTALRKVEFETQYDRRKFATDGGISRLFYNLPCEQQYLIDKYSGLNKSLEFSQFDFKTAFIDIETWSPNEFPVPEQAKHPINLITIYNSEDKCFYTWGLKNDYVSPSSNIKYVKCETEQILLKQFLKHWKRNEYDIVTGWNSHGFDIPYIINRIINVLGEESANDLSPVGKLWFRQGIPSQFGKEVGRWYIYGISNLDYLDIYKKFTPGDRESYNLNYIGELELGEGKIKYNATDLAKLSESDWKTFVDYNIQDVNILIKLEDNKRFFELIKSIAYKGLTNLEASLGTISVVTGAMAQTAREKNLVIPTFKHSLKTDYNGGYVREPERGLQESVVSFDANSLYPNTIITLNISPETKVGKIISKTDNEIKIQLVNGSTYNVSPDKFSTFINKEQLSISKALVLYSQKNRGFCPQLIDTLYSERVAVQKDLKKIKKEIAQAQKNKTSNDVIFQLQKKAKQLHSDQFSKKILLNSIYGTFANRHSPFYDIDAAASITLTGQATIKQSSKIIQSFGEERYQLKNNLTIYNDTDSVYFTIKPILDKLNIQLVENNNITPEAHKIVNEAGEYLNAKITEWAKATLKTTDCRLVFKREAICPAGIFQEKKRYILHVLDEEGIPCDKLKFVGVEIARSVYSNSVKDLIRQVVNSIIKTRDINNVNTIYENCYEKFKSLDISDISFRSSIKNYDKYKSKSEGLRVGKGTPVHVKGSIYYNELIKKLGIDTKYESITSGNKIKWFYCAPNAYNIKCLSYNTVIPEEFNIKPDYEFMFDKLVRPAVDRLYECIGWPIQNFKVTYANNLLALFS